MGRIGQTLLSGTLAALPLALTVAVIAWLVVTIAAYIGPNSQIGQLLTSLGMGGTTSSVAAYISGVALVIAGIYVLGLLVETRAGNWLSALFEGIIGRLPLISSVYGLSKHVAGFMDVKGADSVKSMKPVWCFFGGEPGAAVLALQATSKPVMVGDHAYVGVLVPSAPVPVGGALVYVPSGWVRPAECGVEELMSVYVSMGITPPPDIPRRISEVARPIGGR